MRFVAVSFLLLIAIKPIPGQAPDKSTDNGGDQKGSGKNGQEPPKQVGPIVLNPIPTPIPQGNSPKQPKGYNPIPVFAVEPFNVRAEVQKDWMDRLNWVFTGILVGVGVFGVWYARKTLKAIEGQLAEIQAAGAQTEQMLTHAGSQADAAKQTAETLINSERAWVVITTIYTGPLVLATSIQVDNNQFRFTIGNKGKTVARVVEIKGESMLIDATTEIPENPPYPTRPYDAAMRDRGFVHGTVLVPNENTQDVSFGIEQAIDDQALRDIRSGNRRLYFYGFIRYFDFAKEERRNQFCYQYISAWSKSEARWSAVVVPFPEYNTHT